MTPLQQLWHLLNFVAPALATALITTGLAKLIWRRELADAGFATLAASACGAGMAALVASVVVTGRDGSMAGYAALVGAQALAIWLFGFRPWRRGAR